MPEMFSASRAKRHMHCHASADLAAAIPLWEPPVEDPKADNAANRGTKMHELFAGLLRLKRADAHHMVKALIYILDVLDQRRYKILIEEKMDVLWLPVTAETTADVVAWVGEEMHVFDLKTGRIPISPIQNEQLLYYAATYWRLAPKVDTFYLHIIQPAADVMESWNVTGKELEAWMVEAFDHAVAIADGDLTFMPGDHCTFCPANPHARGGRGAPLCPAMMKVLYPEPELDTAALLEEEI